MNNIIAVCQDAVLDFAINGIGHAMNNYNKPLM